MGYIKRPDGRVKQMGWLENMAHVRNSNLMLLKGMEGQLKRMSLYHTNGMTPQTVRDLDKALNVIKNLVHDVREDYWRVKANPKLERGI